MSDIIEKIKAYGRECIDIGSCEGANMDASGFRANAERMIEDICQAISNQAAAADTRWQPVGPEARRCRECNAPRKGNTCWKCGGETFKPHHSWVEAEVPDVTRIRALAKEVGYAIGEHGSKERDFDIIAAPWAEDAVGFDELVAHIAKGINAEEVGDREKKPHGRVGVNLQIDGYYKLIDLSVMPRYTAPSGRVAELESRIAALESQLAESGERKGMALSKLQAATHSEVHPRAAEYLIAEAMAALAADKEQK